MIGLNPDCPPSVTMLADHLDSALAAGEDLLAASLPARSDLDEADAEAAPAALDLFVRQLMRLEGSILLRLLQARRLAIEAGKADVTLRAAANLFKAQTETLEDLILKQGRIAGLQLSRPGDSHAYLRSRAMIAPEAASPSPFECVSVGETYRIGGVAPVGLTMDMASSLLDLLDARYGLYAPEVIAEAHDGTQIEAACADEGVGTSAEAAEPLFVGKADGLLDVVAGRTAQLTGDDKDEGAARGVPADAPALS